MIDINFAGMDVSLVPLPFISNSNNLRRWFDKRSRRGPGVTLLNSHEMMIDGWMDEILRPRIPFQFLIQERNKINDISVLEAF